MKPETIASQFSRRLREELGVETMAIIVERNRSNPPGVCASHDFCDPNELMGAVFDARRLNPNTDKGAVIWSRAWSIAKASGFTL